MAETETTAEIGSRNEVATKRHHPEFSGVKEPRVEPKSQTESFLSDLYARRESDEYSDEFQSLDDKTKKKTVLYDLLGFIDAKITDKNTQPKELKSLPSLKESVIKLASDEALGIDEHGMNEREQLENFLFKQYEVWNQTMTSAKDKGEAISAEANRNIINSFVSAINGRPEDDHSIEDEFDQLARSEILTGTDQLELPDYEPTPGNTKNAARALENA